VGRLYNKGGGNGLKGTNRLANQSQGWGRGDTALYGPLQGLSCSEFLIGPKLNGKKYQFYWHNILLNQFLKINIRKSH
jgi:hypothetical protein